VAELDHYPDTPLRQLMAERELSIRGLAKLLVEPGAAEKQVDEQRKTIRRWLQGARPRHTSLDRLAVALGLTPRELSSLYSAPGPADAELARLDARVAALEQAVAAVEQRLFGEADLRDR
jgi:transcriptional regulator with XRE-family HTH domain